MSVGGVTNDERMTEGFVNTNVVGNPRECYELRNPCRQVLVRPDGKAPVDGAGRCSPLYVDPELTPEFSFPVGEEFFNKISDVCKDFNIASVVFTSLVFTVGGRECDLRGL